MFDLNLLGLEEEVVDRIEINVAGGRGRCQETGPLPKNAKFFS